MGAMKELEIDRYYLNSLMEFDHVIRVHEDGTITEPQGFWAPNLLDSELDDKGWTLFTHGYSGQYNYSGPVMHNSEFIGGDLAKDIISQPGLYVAVVANHTCEDHEEECDCDTQEGWAVAFREWEEPHNGYPHLPGALYGCMRCESQCFCEEVRKGLTSWKDVQCVHCDLQG